MSFGAGAPRPEGIPPGYPFDPQMEVSPRQVRDLLAADEPRVVLVDCRTRAEWHTARIEGAILIPLDQIPARFGEIVGAMGGGGAAGKAVVVHCHHGMRSLRAAAYLRERGVEARSMAGGIDLWSADIDPSVPRY